MGLFETYAINLYVTKRFGTVTGATRRIWSVWELLASRWCVVVAVFICSVDCISSCKCACTVHRRKDYFPFYVAQASYWATRFVPPFTDQVSAAGGKKYGLDTGYRDVPPPPLQIPGYKTSFLTLSSPVLSLPWIFRHEMSPGSLYNKHTTGLTVKNSRVKANKFECRVDSSGCDCWHQVYTSTDPLHLCTDVFFFYRTLVGLHIHFPLPAYLCSAVWSILHSCEVFLLLYLVSPV